MKRNEKATEVWNLIGNTSSFPCYLNSGVVLLSTRVFGETETVNQITDWHTTALGYEGNHTDKDHRKPQTSSLSTAKLDSNSTRNYIRII